MEELNSNSNNLNLEGYDEHIKSLGLDSLDNSELNYNPQQELDNLIGQGITDDFSTDALTKANVGNFNAHDHNIQNQFYDRYAAHGDFDDLGFTPYRDNETLYNEEGSWLGEMTRAYTQFRKIVPAAMMDAAGISSITNPDFAHDFESIMAVGTSTKGGFGGFAINLGLNAGYTAGIALELVAEEALMAGGAALMAGSGIGLGGAAATVGLMAARAARGINKIKKALGIGLKVEKGLDDMKDLNATRKAFNTFLSGAKNAGNRMIPLSKTRGLLRNAENAEDYGKLGHKVFGSLYKDLRELKLAWNESALEGGSTQIEMERDLMAEFKSQHGRYPDETEALAIAEQAKKAGTLTSMMNFPAIYLSNQITFDGLLGKRSRITDEIITSKNGKFIFNKGKFVDAAKEFKSSFGMYAKNPKMIGKALTKYSTANFAEGIQESMQESISEASHNYYMDDYTGNVSRGGFYNYLLDGIGSQASATGFETFMSGFLMGGPVAVVSNRLSKVKNLASIDSSVGDTTAAKMVRWGQDKFAAGVDAYRGDNSFSTSQTEARTKAIKDKNERDAKLDKELELLNTAYDLNPNDFFNKALDTLEEAGHLRNVMGEAQKTGDNKLFKDAEQKLEQNWIYPIIESGTLPIFMDKMRTYTKMTQEELSGITELSVEDFSRKVETAIKGAENMQATYDYFTKKYTNPYNPRKYKAGDPRQLEEIINYNSWNTAVKDAVMAQDDFNKILDRTNSILSSIVKISGLSDAYYSDITSLLNSKNLNDALTKLEQEYKSLNVEGEDASGDLKKMATENRRKHAALTTFQDSLSDMSAKVSKNQSRKAKAKLKKAYKNYLNLITEGKNEYLNNDKVNESLKAIVDNHSLTAELSKANDAVNTFLDPNKFLNRQKINYDIQAAQYANKGLIIKKSLEEFRRIADENALLNALFDMGMFFKPKAWKDLKENNIMPSELYYVNEAESENINQDEVYVKSGDYYRAVKLIKETFPDLTNVLTRESYDENNKDIYQNFAQIADNDKRTLKQLEEQYGITDENRNQERPVKEIMDRVINSEYASEREKALAVLIKSKASDDDMITFVTDSSKPGSYSIEKGSIIDLRYSSEDNTVFGTQGQGVRNSAEHNILKEEVVRLMGDSLSTDSQFKKAIKELYDEAFKSLKLIRTQNKDPYWLAYSGEAFDETKSEDERLTLFIAGALNNPQIQSLLNAIPYGKQQKLTLWDALVEAIMKTFQNLVSGKLNKGTLLNSVLFTVSAKVEGKPFIDIETGNSSKKRTPSSKTKKRQDVLKSIQNNTIEEALKNDLIKAFKDHNKGNKDMSMYTDIETTEAFKEFILDNNIKTVDEVINAFEKEKQERNSSGKGDSQRTRINKNDRETLIAREFPESMVNAMKNVTEFYEIFDSGMNYDEYKKLKDSEIDAEIKKIKEEIAVKAEEFNNKIDEILNNTNTTSDEDFEDLDDLYKQIAQYDKELLINNVGLTVASFLKDNYKINKDETRKKIAKKHTDALAKSFAIGEEVSIFIENDTVVGKVSVIKTSDTAGNGKAYIEVEYNASDDPNKIDLQYKRFTGNNMKNISKDTNFDINDSTKNNGDYIDPSEVNNSEVTPDPEAEKINSQNLASEVLDQVDFENGDLVTEDDFINELKNNCK